MKPVRVKDFETWNTSLSFLFGRTPKVTMICGKCSNAFSKRFQSIDFSGNKYPHAMCPSCHTVNYVPITIE